MCSPYPNEDYYGQSRVCSLSPKEFELYCKEILRGYAEARNLQGFKIEHDVNISTHDGTYQIDVYAEYSVLGTVKVLCECKHYKNSVSREKVAVLAEKLRSIGANKGILLSTTGFQKGAIKYAEAHGIALVQVFDTHEEWYSHSGGPDAIEEEDDPIIYGEKHMPRYQAHLIEESGKKVIYPTRKMVEEIYKEMGRLFERKYGNVVNLSTGTLGTKQED